MLGLFKQSPLTARVQLPNQAFDYKSSFHLDIITQRITRFKQAQTILHTIDSHIIKGLTIGSCTWIGSYIFPLVTVSIVGYCFATHYASHRPACFKQYQETLNDLIEVYAWSMGKQTGNHWQKIGIKPIQSLILTLGPYVTQETICTWSINDLQTISSSPLRLFIPFCNPKREHEPSDEFKHELKRFMVGEQTKEWKFTLYGENCTDDLLGILQNKCESWANTTINLLTARRP